MEWSRINREGFWEKPAGFPFGGFLGKNKDPDMVAMKGPFALNWNPQSEHFPGYRLPKIIELPT